MAIAQMGTRAGDFAHTAERMVAYSRSAAEKGVELLVFPAMALCGASGVPAPDQEGFVLDLADALVGLLDDLACPCLVPVCVEVEGTRMPEALIVDGGRVTAVRLGTLLAQLRERRREEAAGGARAPLDFSLPEVEFDGVRLGVAFSYDDLDDYVSYDYDVDAVVFLSGYGFTVDDPESAMGSALAEARFADDAADMGAWVVGVGSLGCYDGQVFVGSSFFLAPWGEIAAQGPTLEEALVVCELDPHDEGPLRAPLAPEVFDPTMLAWEALARGIAELVGSLGATDAVVLVDGGLTSSLVATLAVDALGPTRVHALVPDTRVARVTRATNSLVRALRLPDANVTHVDVSREPDLDLRADLAEAHLAALARATGGVALGRASKTELALRRGCRASASQLEPLADLYLSDVLGLARLRNTVSPVIPRSALRDACPRDILDLAPAAVSDERRLEFVDSVLCSHVEMGNPLSDVVDAMGHPDEVAAVIGRLREVDPVRPDSLMVVLSSRTLAEVRGPSGLAWHDRVRPVSERLDEESLARILLDAAGVPSDGEGGQTVADLADLFGLGDDGDRSGAGSAGPGGGAADGRSGGDARMGDLLGYLRDFSVGGAFDGETGAPGAPGHRGGPGRGGAGGAHRPPSGPTMPSDWTGPFSEN